MKTLKRKKITPRAKVSVSSEANNHVEYSLAVAYYMGQSGRFDRNYLPMIVDKSDWELIFKMAERKSIRARFSGTASHLIKIVNELTTKG